MTKQVLELVSVLLSRPDEEWYGLQLAAEAGLKSGTVYLVLARLKASAWLTDRLEEIDPSVEGRPRRRLYRLTAEGRRCAEEALYEHVRVLAVASGRVAAALRSVPGTLVIPAT